MPLHPGYNLVTGVVEETEAEMPALAFFRRLAADKDVATRVTVTGMEDLIYHASEETRDDVIRFLRDVLRQTGSLHGQQAVQFVFDGELVDDDTFTVRIERGGGAVYLPIGNLFVEQPNLVGADPQQAVARK